MSRSLRQLFQNPSPPIISRADYVPSEMTVGVLGQDVSDLMPGAGQNAIPGPQMLYDLGSYFTPIRYLWRKPRNVIS